MRNTLPDGNAEILVQSDEPVPVRGLVEEGALDGHGSRREERHYRVMHTECRRKLLAERQIEEIARAWPAFGRAADGGSQVGALFTCKDSANLSESQVFEHRKRAHFADACSELAWPHREQETSLQVLLTAGGRAARAQSRSYASNAWARPLQRRLRTPHGSYSLKEVTAARAVVVFIPHAAPFESSRP